MKVRMGEIGDMVADMSAAELEREIASPDKLRIWEGTAGWRNLQVAWAPFDTVENTARIAIFGVTPGREQMGNALRAYHKARLCGSDHLAAVRYGKGTGAFSGEMQDTLIRLLDEVSIPRLLGAHSSHALWGAQAKQVHFSSVLRWPVFCDQKDTHKILQPLQNYTGGTPSITAQRIFISMLKNVLVPEILSLPEDCLIAPLGSAAQKAMTYALSGVSGFDRKRLLIGLPHPSGAARDVSSQFLGDPPSDTRTKPLNPAYRENAMRLRGQVEGLIRADQRPTCLASDTSLNMQRQI